MDTFQSSLCAAEKVRVHRLSVPAHAANWEGIFRSRRDLVGGTPRTGALADRILPDPARRLQMDLAVIVAALGRPGLYS